MCARLCLTLSVICVLLTISCRSGVISPFFFFFFCKVEKRGKALSMFFHLGPNFVENVFSIGFQDLLLDNKMLLLQILELVRGN